MTRQQFNKLKRGDIVQHVSKEAFGHSWVVTDHRGDSITLVDSCEATNPVEWEKVNVRRPRPNST